MVTQFPVVLAGALTLSSLLATRSSAATADGTWSIVPELPGRQDGIALLNDARRHRVLLFGGGTYAGENAVIWARPTDGSSHWLPLPALGAPSALGYSPVSILDVAQDRLVVWDGSNKALWTVALEGTLRWTRCVIAGGPTLWSTAAAYDPVHRRMLLWSGNSPSQSVDPVVWALGLDDATWTWTKLPTQGPGPTGRMNAIAAVDPAHDRLVVHGGIDFSYSAPHMIRGDVWALPLSGAPKWTPLYTDDSVSDLCYWGHAAVLDTMRQRLLFFGGGTATAGLDHADVHAFALDGSNEWSEVVPPNAERGSIEFDDAAAYDSQTDAVIEYGLGGHGEATHRLQLSPSPGWSLVEPAQVEPPQRFGQAAAFDPARNRWISFGGRQTYYVYYEFPTTTYDDLWSLELLDRPTWKNLLPASESPPARQDGRMICDTRGGRMLLFGGQVTTGVGPSLRYDHGLGTPHFYGDTWSLSLTDPPTWSRIVFAESGPAPRDGHVMVLDSKRHRLLLFGGRDSLGGRGDLWTLSLEGKSKWTALAPEGAGPSPRWQAVGCIDPVADVLVIAAGRDGSGALTDAFELPLGERNPTWRALATTGNPAPMGAYARPYVFDAARRRLLIFGNGEDASGAYSAPPLQSWQLSLENPATWSSLAPEGDAPSAAYGMAAAMDPAHDRLLLLGGTNGEKGEETRSDHRLITFEAAIHAPDCSAARPSVSVLWPPDHRMVDVEIVGVSSSDGDPVTITFDNVTQDERSGSDHRVWNCTGARIVGGRLELRAERDAHGNGRVYRIAFTANDRRGGTCRDTVSVCVPLDMRRGHDCIDDGQMFIATADCGPRRGTGASAGEKDPGIPITLDLRAARAGGGLTLLEYALPEESDVQLTIYDLAGRQVTTILHAHQTAGVHRASWSTSGLGTGIYFCRLQTEHDSMTRSVPVLR